MISPTCVGRTDLPQYPHSCELLQNMIPMLSGGAYRRPGTLGVDSIPGYESGSAYFINAPLRGFPFIINQSEAYYVITNLANGDGAVFRATGNSSGNFVRSKFNNYLAYPSPPIYPIDLGLLTGLNSPATTTTFAATGEEDDQVFQQQYAQVGDYMWIVHPNSRPMVLRRIAKDTFQYGAFDQSSGTNHVFSGTRYLSDFFNSIPISRLYPYLNQNITGVTLTPSATTGSITVTATIPSDWASYDFGFGAGVIFPTNAKGMIFRMDHGSGAVGAFIVTSRTSATVAVGYVIEAFTATTATGLWWEAAWSDARGWPRTVGVFQQRLCMAGTAWQPDTLWFSQTNNYGKFSALNETAPSGTVIVRGAPITVTTGYINFQDDSSQGDGKSTGPTGIQPFRITLSQSRLDKIQWLSPDKELLVGTSTQEWIITPQNGSFDVANSAAQLQSTYGSDFIPAVRIGYELMFVTQQQSEVRAYQYNYIDASFFGEPVQLMFDEYPKPELGTQLSGRRKYRQMAWDVTRSTLWCLDTCGNFFGMTRDRKLQVTMWHTHQFGGYDPTKATPNNGTNVDPAYWLPDGGVVSFAVLPNPQFGVNDIWMIIKRTVNGHRVWCVERMIGKNTNRPSAYEQIAPGSSDEPLQVDNAFITVDNGDGTFNYTTGVPYPDGASVIGTYFSKTYGLFKIAAAWVGLPNVSIYGIDVGFNDHGTATLQQPLPPDYGGLTPYHIITLGLPYTSIIKTARIDAGSVIGTAQGAIKRIAKSYIRFYKTLMAKVGTAPGGEGESPLETVAFKPNPTSPAKSPDIFTGDKRVIMPTTFDRDGYVYIVQDQPLPMTVVSVVAEGEEFD